MKLLTIPKAAKLIGLSRQRVHLLVQEKRIATDPASGLISTAEITRFKKIKRVNGRPKAKSNGGKSSTKRKGKWDLRDARPKGG